MLNLQSQNTLLIGHGKRIYLIYLRSNISYPNSIKGVRRGFIPGYIPYTLGVSKSCSFGLGVYGSQPGVNPRTPLTEPG